MDTRRTIGFKDIELTCIECGKSFTWGKGEQLYYRDRGLSEPKRCPQCRAARRKKLPHQILDSHDDVIEKLREVSEKWKA
jgi:NAD-dependent SIR2 family protein deacetylase